MKINMSLNKGISSKIIWDGKNQYEKKNKVQRIKEKFIDLFGPITSSDIDLILKVLHKYEENTVDVMSKYELSKPVQSRIIFESDTDSADSPSDYRSNESKTQNVMKTYSKPNSKSKRKLETDKTSKQKCIRKKSNISESKSAHSKNSKFDENVRLNIENKNNNDYNSQAHLKNTLVKKPDATLSAGNKNTPVIIEHIKSEPLDFDNSYQNKIIDWFKDQYHDPHEAVIKKEPLTEELNLQIKNCNTNPNNVNASLQPKANDNANSTQIKKKKQEESTDESTFKVTELHSEPFVSNDADDISTTSNTTTNKSVSISQSSDSNELINSCSYIDNRYKVAVTIPHTKMNSNHDTNNISSNERNIHMTTNMPNIVISDVGTIGPLSNAFEHNSSINEVLKNIIFVMYHFQKYAKISQKNENCRSHDLEKEKSRKTFIACHNYAYKNCYSLIESEILPYDYSNAEYLCRLINKAKDLANTIKHPLPFDGIAFLRIFCNFIELRLEEKRNNCVHNEHIENIHFQNESIDKTVLNSSIANILSNTSGPGYNSNNDKINNQLTNKPKDISNAKEDNYYKKNEDSTKTSNQRINMSIVDIKHQAIKLRQYLSKYTTVNETNTKLESILPNKIYGNSPVISSVQVPIQNVTTYSEQISTAMPQNSGTVILQRPSMISRTAAIAEHNVINSQQRSSMSLPFQTEMVQNFDSTSFQNSSVPRTIMTHPHLATNSQQRSSVALPVYPEMSQNCDNRQWISPMQQHDMASKTWYPPTSQHCNGSSTQRPNTSVPPKQQHGMVFPPTPLRSYRSSTQRSLPTRPVPPQNFSTSPYHSRLPVQPLMPENVNTTSGQKSNVGLSVQQVPNQNYHPGSFSGYSLPMQSSMIHEPTPYVQQRSVSYSSGHHNNMQHQTPMTYDSPNNALTASSNTPIAQHSSSSTGHPIIENLLNDSFVHYQPDSETSIQKQQLNYAQYEACNQNSIAPAFAPEQIRSSVSRDSGFMSPSWNDQPVSGADGVMNQPWVPFGCITHVTSLNPNAKFNTELRPCVVCKKNTKLRCSGCLSIYLCSIKCQHEIWGTHSKVCMK